MRNAEWLQAGLVKVPLVSPTKASRLVRCHVSVTLVTIKREARKGGVSARPGLGSVALGGSMQRIRPGPGLPLTFGKFKQLLQEKKCTASMGAKEHCCLGKRPFSR